MYGMAMEVFISEVV